LGCCGFKLTAGSGLGVGENNAFVSGICLTAFSAVSVKHELACASMSEVMEEEEREAWKGISSMEMNQRNTK
jgi:hypothetical protein